MQFVKYSGNIAGPLLVTFRGASNSRRTIITFVPRRDAAIIVQYGQFCVSAHQSVHKFVTRGTTNIKCATLILAFIARYRFDARGNYNQRCEYTSKLAACTGGRVDNRRTVRRSHDVYGRAMSEMSRSINGVENQSSSTPLVTMRPPLVTAADQPYPLSVWYSEAQNSVSDMALRFIHVQGVTSLPKFRCVQ